LSISPYLEFSRSEWAHLRGATPLTLSESDLDRLRGLNEPVSMGEVREVYLAVSRLLNLHFSATDRLHGVIGQFLGKLARRTPYVVAIAGSVSSGKSTTSRVLAALIESWPDQPRVALVTTDGFLHPNRILTERGLMERKGFPESYDVNRLVRFMADLKSNRFPLRVPRYSHRIYDVLEEESTLEECDVLILEGLNVLQTGTAHSVFVSDYIDFSIFIEAQEDHLQEWFLQRFRGLRDTAFQDPESFFHGYAAMPEEDALARARGVWERINLANLRENIAPTREKASLILQKGRDHGVERVFLRRL
jgi:type I pantothenate kinase